MERFDLLPEDVIPLMNEIQEKMIKFAEWCFQQKNYFYDPKQKSWYSKKTLKPLSWDHMIEKYLKKIKEN